MNQDFYQELLNIISKEQIQIEEPMRNHTTFRVGGPAEFFVQPKTAQEVQGLVKLCKEKEVPYYIVGNGSNLLVSDKGYRGVMIQIFKEMNQIQIEGELVKAQAGALLSAIASKALEAGLAGFSLPQGYRERWRRLRHECRGIRRRDEECVREVTVLTPEGEVLAIPDEEAELGYRTSIIAKKGYIVLEAVMRLQKGEKEEIKARMDELKEKRISKQPLEYPSAGSTFKRPEGYFAGKLIQDAGLQGFSVGGAQVSMKHCGFVINKDNATAADVAELMRKVSEQVEEKFGVRLEPEVKRLGEF